MSRKPTIRILTQYQLRTSDGQVRFLENEDALQEPKARIQANPFVAVAIAKGAKVSVRAIDQWEEIENELGECLKRTPHPYESYRHKCFTVGHRGLE